jgi:hypothetical protein
MPDTSTPADPQAHARAAGALYLVIIVLGLSGELLVRSALVVPGDPAATAQNILGHPTLFRLGLAADAVMALCDVALAVLLYVLLRPVSQTLSLMAMVFRLVQTAILGGNLLNHHTALQLLDKGPGFGGFDAAQLGTLALMSLETQSHGYDLGLLFFGASCLILGYLLIRASYFPRFLGPLVAAAGVVYLAGSALRFLAPHLSEAFAPAYALPLLAEFGFCLWLLARGVDRRRWQQAIA